MSPRRLPVIDGLRAVAIVAAVLFHVFPQHVRGGFIGVDIFFVISGFVIALRYLPTLASGDVRTSNFFYRRIQRLAPAYLALIVVVTVVSWVLLVPMDLRNFGEGLVGQAFYAQNIVFWHQGDYFLEREYRPLLHTWSLAVEEQFYLLFPLLALLYRRSRRVAVVLLAVGVAASLALGFVLDADSPKTAFFLLPTRVWELGVGIGAALLFPRVKVGRWATPLFVLALVMIGYAVLGPFEEAVFPGRQALIAVAATVIVCLVQLEISPPVAAILTNRASQHLGRLSYSWYLWHWPVTAFFFVVAERSPNLMEGLACLLAGLLLAEASYRWIEQPTRRWSGLRRAGPSLALLAVFLGFSFVAGAYLVHTRGVLDSYPDDKAALYAAQMDRVSHRCPLMARLELYDTQVCRLTEGPGPKVLVIGDSHAERVAPMLTRKARTAGAALYLTKRKCKAIDYGTTSFCSEGVWQEVAHDIRRFGITRVVLVSYWPAKAQPEVYRRAVQRFAALGVTTYFQRVVPSGPYFDPVARVKGASGGGGYTVADYNRTHVVQNLAAAQLQQTFGARVIVLDPLPALCPQGRCDFDTDGKPNYSDAIHLNSVGAERLSRMFDRVFAPQAR